MELKQDFISLIKDKFADYQSRIEKLNSPPSLSIRINAKKLQNEIPYPKVPWCSTGYYLQERPSFTFDPLFHTGAYYVQEASSMFLEQVLKHSLNLEKPLLGLDLCAAPGGKTTHIASLLSENSLLVANEVIKQRAQILKENVIKSGNGNTIITSNEVKDFKKLNGFFDFVVVDAPCSGEGMFRKDLKSRKEWSLDNVKLCSARQKKILGNIYSSVKTDGIIIYSTCTFNSFENEENIKWFVDNFNVKPVKIPIQQSWGIEEITDTNGIGYRFFPGKVAGEGFFICAFKKIEQEKKIKYSKNGTLKKTQYTIDFIDQDCTIYEKDNTLFALDQNWVNHFILIEKNLNVIYKGLEIAEAKKKNIVPKHALALNTRIGFKNVFFHNLSKEDAIKYLKKENIVVKDTTGWIIVCYNNLPLGWIKSISGRSNNYYPKEWRIRSSNTTLKTLEL